MRQTIQCLKAGAQAAKVRRVQQKLSEIGVRVTGKTGLKAIEDSRPILNKTYKSILERVSALPKESVYRQATEAFVRRKMDIIKKNEDAPLEKLEEDLDGELLIEEIIAEAKDELSLVERMIQSKP